MTPHYYMPYEIQDELYEWSQRFFIGSAFHYAPLQHTILYALKIITYLCQFQADLGITCSYNIGHYVYSSKKASWFKERTR